MPLASNLDVNVGATDVTVAALTIGSSTTSCDEYHDQGGRVVFENIELNNTIPEPDVCTFQCGALLITSTGVAAQRMPLAPPWA